MINGYGAVECCYRFAGVIGIAVDGFSLRDLWLMYCGKMQAIRQQVIWQSQVLLAEKLNMQEFLKHGSTGGGVANPVRHLSEDTREKIAVFQGYINRGLPEPDINSPTWREDAEAAFAEHDQRTEVVDG